MEKKILTSDEAYDIAHTHVSHWELDKDDITNYPTDPGGPTRNGVSLAYLKGLGIELGDLNKDGKIDIDDIRLVSLDVAKGLFKNTFWDGGKAALLPPLTSIVYYDFSVTSGAGRAAIELQKTINILYPGLIETCAANIGPRTKQACQQVITDSRDLELALKFIETRWLFYKKLSTDNPPKYGPFIDGWTARCNACRALVEDVAKNGVTPEVYARARRGYGF